MDSAYGSALNISIFTWPPNLKPKLQEKSNQVVLGTPLVWHFFAYLLRHLTGLQWRSKWETKVRFLREIMLSHLIWGKRGKESQTDRVKKGQRFSNLHAREIFPILCSKLHLFEEKILVLFFVADEWWDFFPFSKATTCFFYYYCTLHRSGNSLNHHDFADTMIGCDVTSSCPFLLYMRVSFFLSSSIHPVEIEISQPKRTIGF